jgi:hypothetical protein
MPNRGRHAIAVASVASSLLGCIGQNVSVDAPTLRVVSVVIHVLPDSQTASADIGALGWGGGVPGATVVIRQADPAGAVVDSGQTDADGKLDVGAISPGVYRISLLRVLGAVERSKLSPNSALEAFALEANVSLGGAATATMRALGSLRGSLVTSEWFFAGGYYGQYPYTTDGYWKLYNNSDTTVYLDGLILGAGYNQNIEGVSYSCAQAATDFEPPDGVWVSQLNRFPGTGRDYPVAPGQAVVVATDAIDHRPYFQNALDLSNANFEFIGSADTDNPAVPNMIWLGPEQSPEHHGESFISISGVPLILSPMSVDSLPRKITPGGYEYWKVPRDEILDVFAWSYYNTYGHVPCQHMLNTSINADIAIGGYGADPFLVSTHRRVLYERSDGRKILIHTTSSSTDFTDGPRTPGVIP